MKHFRLLYIVAYCICPLQTRNLLPPHHCLPGDNAGIVGERDRQPGGLSYGCSQAHYLALAGNHVNLATGSNHAIKDWHLFELLLT